MFAIFNLGVVAGALKGCAVKVENAPSRVIHETPFEAWQKGEPHSEYMDWRALGGTTRVGTQLLPHICGSCWAFATSGAMSDRVKIATGLEINLSPQGLLDCAGSDVGTCDGGSHSLANQFIADTGLTDETCLPYEGVDYTNWAETPCEERMCKTCSAFTGECTFDPDPPRVKAAEFGEVTGVDAMKAEIAERGPIACLMYAHAPIFTNYTGGVLVDTTAYDGITHVVVVVGWQPAALPNGTMVDAWIVRNSFGTHWGELGYYRQAVGLDIYNMESNPCAWATPNTTSLRDLKARAAGQR